jgi:hypothetical protein
MYYTGAEADLHCASVIPEDELLSVVLAAFIDHVHPQMPFIDLTAFKPGLVSSVAGGHFSLFVLQAIIAVAWQYCSEDWVSAAGFSCPLDASRSYLRKAKVLLKHF